MGIIIEVRNPLEDLEDKIKAYKRRSWIKLIVTTLTLFAAAISTYMLMEMQTYTNTRVSANYGKSEEENVNYYQYADGVLKYSRDGIAFLDKKGQEQWNQSYQIKNPFLNVYKESVAIGERGGNDIYVFNKKGLKGEIHTNLPIEDMVVSEQGIVSVLLKNENTPLIVCYDAMGNVLIEHKTSLSGKGYPIGMAIAPDGKKLQVAYLGVIDGVEATRIVYYDFSTVKTESEEYQVGEDVYKNEIFPTSFFIDSKTSVVIGDSSFVIYKGADSPKASQTITLDKEVKSVFYGKKEIGFVLKNIGQEEYELRLYNMNGKQILSKTITGQYSHVKVTDREVILYDGKKCCIYSEWGVKKFEGEMDKEILEIFPVEGINKYLMMSANGIEELRLVK